MPPEITTPEPTAPETPTSEAITTPPADTKPTVDLDSLVSEENRDKPWFQDLKKADNPIERLFKDHEGAQKLLGNKGVTIPGEDATEEQIQEFNRLLGVSEKIEDYKYTPPEWSKEDEKVGKILDSFKDEEVLNEMAPIFQQNGISPAKAHKLIAAYDKVVFNRQKEALEEYEAHTKEQDEKFITEAKSLFGNDAEAVLQKSGDVLKKVIPENLVPRFRNMSPEDLVSVAALMHHTYKLYGREGDITMKDGESVSANFAARRAEIQKLMSNPASRDEGHPEYEKIRAQIDNFYKNNF